MNILIAPDSLKGSLTAQKASLIIKEALLAASPQVCVKTLPLSDGGEGALEIWSSLGLGSKVEVPSMDPIGREITAEYFKFNDGTAWIELSQASGLVLLEEGERNPVNTSTFGTGILIRHALKHGAEKITLGLGGSATNDGGAGLLAALGFDLHDIHGASIYPSGGNLDQIVKIVPPYIPNVEIVVACDVNNPLCGPDGASVVYGPQKGATPEMVHKLDANLKHWSQLLERSFRVSVSEIPGAGAAGGAGVALLAAYDAELKPGFNLIAEVVGLEEALEWADVVITAEGILDDQSFSGKATVSLCQKAKKLNCKTLVFAGTVEGQHDKFSAAGVDKAIQIRPQGMTVEQSMKKASELLNLAVQKTFMT